MSVYNTPAAYLVRSKPLKKIKCSVLSFSVQQSIFNTQSSTNSTNNDGVLVLSFVLHTKKPSQAKPSQAKPSHGTPSQAKPKKATSPISFFRWPGTIIKRTRRVSSMHYSINTAQQNITKFTTNKIDLPNRTHRAQRKVEKKSNH